ncbi:hypothetical protein GTV32_03705 [Gordonia sp. SID5947]|uniref:hypothetical protein n=1 Tax=Gordonia sp. SID5947 TaxID=2690315 RepID=UPI00136C1DFC|nr:hypothetical protein [Gordonia sp. SID5947]MYR05473.1 hypothetical protein [Gordonia sp. SID5947]
MNTTWTRHVAAASAGAVAANVVPHLAHALAGKPFPTPFADPPGVGDSSPLENLVWASANAGATGAIVYSQRAHLHRAQFWGVFGISASAAGFALRSYFERMRGQG